MEGRHVVIVVWLSRRRNKVLQENIACCKKWQNLLFRVPLAGTALLEIFFFFFKLKIEQQTLGCWRSNYNLGYGLSCFLLKSLFSFVTSAEMLSCSNEHIYNKLQDLLGLNKYWASIPRHFTSHLAVKSMGKAAWFLTALILWHVLLKDMGSNV